MNFISDLPRHGTVKELDDRPGQVRAMVVLQEVVGPTKVTGPSACGSSSFSRWPISIGKTTSPGAHAARRGSFAEFGQPPLDRLHIRPAAITGPHRNGARPGKHDVIGIRLVEDVMIARRFAALILRHRNGRWAMLRQHLVPFHQELCDQRRRPGCPGLGRRMKRADQPG